MAKKAAKNWTPAAEEIEQGWIQVDNCMRFCFSYFLWQKEYGAIKPHFEEKQYLRATALISSLINIRALDEFFSIDRFVRPSDIRAEQYHGFKNPGCFLSDDERTLLHRLVGHITYDRFHYSGTRFATLDLVSRAYANHNEFLNFLHDATYANHPHARAYIEGRQKMYEGWLAEMQTLPPGLPPC